MSNRQANRHPQFDPKKIPQKNFEMVQKEFQQKQAETQRQQQEKQNAIQQKIMQMTANDNTVITAVISEDTYESLKSFILPLFAHKTSYHFKVSPANYLELFERIYEKNETNFNLVEIGMITEMVNTTYHHLEDADEVKAVLKFRAEAHPLFMHYNHRQQAIIKFANSDAQQTLEVVKNSIIS